MDWIGFHEIRYFAAEGWGWIRSTMGEMVESHLFVVDRGSGRRGSREDGVGFRFCMWPRKDWVGWRWRCEAF